MNGVRVLDPQKLKDARGQRTQKEIAAATGHVFSEQQISGYEKGKFRPKPEKLPILLRALGVEYDEVSTSISPQIVTAG